jgi:hypothetical protein
VVHIDVGVIQGKNCFRYTGLFEDIWPITVVEGRKREMDCSKVVGVKTTKDSPSSLSEVWWGGGGIYGSNVSCLSGLISACS